MTRRDRPARPPRPEPPPREQKPKPERPWPERPAKPDKAPIIGSIVHYVIGGSHLAAIVTAPEYPSEQAGEALMLQALIVFPAQQMPFHALAVYDLEYRSMTWHWPEDEPEEVEPPPEEPPPIVPPEDPPTAEQLPFIPDEEN